MFELLELAVRNRAYHLLEVTSAAQVQRAVELNEPDIVVLDLEFPDGDGRALLRQLKASEATLGIPVIVWSGRYGYPSDPRISLALGADCYVHKSDPMMVVTKIEDILLSLARTSRA